MTEIHGFEDEYTGVVFDSFDEMMGTFAAYCEDSELARLNIPVWVDDTSETINGPVIIVGVFMPRHGRCVQWVAPYAGPDRLQELQERVLSVWAGRAEDRFARYAAGPVYA